MAYKHKDMTGTIFKNKRKQEGDRTPDYRGEIMVSGDLFEIALWIKDGAKGKFFSAKIQPSRNKPNDGPRQEDPRYHDSKTEIPF